MNTVAPTQERQSFLRVEFVCLLLVLLHHAGLLFYLAAEKSPVSDEFGHMAAGLSHWGFGRFDLYAVNPPLVRMIATAPVVFIPHNENWGLYSKRISERSEFGIGFTLVKENPGNWRNLFLVGRCMCIPFSTMGAILCFYWSRKLYGRTAGWVAILLWCICPNCMTYSAMMTPDGVATSIGIAAWWCVVRWLKAPGLRRAIFAGILLGLAVLAKSTLVVLLIVLPFALMFVRLSQRSNLTTSFRNVALQATALACISLYVINLGYGFEETMTRFGEFQFQSTGFRTIQEKCGHNLIGNLLLKFPVPLPKNMLLGMDYLRFELEQHYWSYLRGEHRFGGWWYYYLYACLVKIPLGSLWLLFVSIATFIWSIRRNPIWLDELLLLAPSIAVLFVVSSQTGFNHHIRYVLPAFPYLYIFASRVAQFNLFMSRPRMVLVGLLTVWTGYSSFSVFPYSMSYFNELAGGPENGWRHLSFSNIDWGQDMPDLYKWQQSHAYARPLFIRTKSFAPSHDFGIVDDQFPTLKDSNEIVFPPGWYVLGVNELLNHNSQISGFLKLTPTDRIGYSMYVYHLTSEQTLKPYFPVDSNIP